MTPVTGIDPRITTLEMQTAYRYFNRLSVLGGQILGLLWAMATVKINPLVAVAAGLGCLAYILYIGHDYRQQYAEITKAFTGRYRLRLLLSGWPMLVVIVIVSGLLSKGLSWQQIGDHKEQVLALAAFPIFTWFKQWWKGQ
ncbi:hypothetical protein [Pseudomonas sp. ICMP 561]|uniref:hypothetical protein n=1 Tax=Pseudomonas sp. ICMP 561 TaxID=1718918 RepID=UPI000C06A02A|nr:hypothetical protein [Pseudomonas sp. ICMP 561]PHN17151.1 hypothetical protein AO242_20850 [Pseudomonas sp. ICMP 561]